MHKRFVTIWLPYLKTDWYIRRMPALAKLPFVLKEPHHGRMMITAANAIAEQKGIFAGMALADARAIEPLLEALDDKPGHAQLILKGLAEWCIRYTPVVAIELPHGLILESTGCAHLWGGDKKYLADIYNRCKNFGYSIRISMADTIGAAWALSRFGRNGTVVNKGEHAAALLPLPAAALRLEPDITDRLNKLGLRHVEDFISIPRPALRRRFGPQLLKRIDEALGQAEEIIQPLVQVAPYQERLPCLEPILTRTGIEIALQKLLHMLGERLRAEGKGLRTCTFKGFRVDGKVEMAMISVNRATCHQQHLFRLFELKLEKFEPALGIELFLLEAGKVEDITITQEKLWEQCSGLENTHLVELLDRFSGKFGEACVHRYLPAEHYWPERSFKPAGSLTEQSATGWRMDKQRPLQLLAHPDPIEVTAPLPDYPPMLFHYKGKRHKVVRADGPERIEQEWWLQQGQHRDYFTVEDEEGHRYWLFRLGNYDSEKFSGWFIHGLFA